MANLVVPLETCQQAAVGIWPQIAPPACCTECGCHVGRPPGQQLELHSRISHLVDQMQLDMKGCCRKRANHGMALRANSCESKRPCSLGLMNPCASDSHRFYSSSTWMEDTNTSEHQIHSRCMEWHIPETPRSAWHSVGQSISGLNPAREQCRVMLMLALMALK